MNKITTGVGLLVLAVLGFVSPAGAQLSEIGAGIDANQAAGESFATGTVVPALVAMITVTTLITLGVKLWKRFGPQKA